MPPRSRLHSSLWPARHAARWQAWLQYFRCRHPEHLCSGWSVAEVPQNEHSSVMCVKGVRGEEQTLKIFSESGGARARARLGWLARPRKDFKLRSSASADRWRCSARELLQSRCGWMRPRRPRRPGLLVVRGAKGRRRQTAPSDRVSASWSTSARSTATMGPHSARCADLTIMDVW